MKRPTLTKLNPRLSFKQLITFVLVFGFILLGIEGKSFALSQQDQSQTEPNTIYVTSSIDTDEQGTLRWAIHQANLTPQIEIIDLSQLQKTIELKQSLPNIHSDILIKGNEQISISGNHRHRIFTIQNGQVTLQNLKILNGLAKGNDGINGAGGSAGIGGGILMEGGNVTLKNVAFTNNQAIGGDGSESSIKSPKSAENTIQQIGGHFYVNRGAITGINGISFGGSDAQKMNLPPININSDGGEFLANRGAVAGVNGIGISGIGAITFAGGGGFGGFGNAGNGGNGGNGGYNGGSGGNGGNGGDGGIGFFGSFGTIDGKGTIGNISFGGGGGFGGLGNAGNGGNGGNICGMSDSNNQSNSSYGYNEDIAKDELSLSLDSAFNQSSDTTDKSNSKKPKTLKEVKKNQENKDKNPEKTKFELSFCGNGGNGGDGGNGGFGGGGGSGGLGGFGGVVGKDGKVGKGGFGGGDGSMSAGGGGAGLGGAIFVKSGHLTLEDTTFIGNMAVGGKGSHTGLGKGGAIFVLTDSLKQSAGIRVLPNVISLKFLPDFQGNHATDADIFPTDNHNIFGVMKTFEE